MAFVKKLHEETCGFHGYNSTQEFHSPVVSLHKTGKSRQTLTERVMPLSARDTVLRVFFEIQRTSEHS